MSPKQLSAICLHVVCSAHSTCPWVCMYMYKYLYTAKLHVSAIFVLSTCMYLSLTYVFIALWRYSYNVCMAEQQLCCRVCPQVSLHMYLYIYMPWQLHIHVHEHTFLRLEPLFWKQTLSAKLSTYTWGELCLLSIRYMENILAQPHMTIQT